jgi:hypothetical protein
MGRAEGFAKGDNCVSLAKIDLVDKHKQAGKPAGDHGGEREPMWR